MNSDLPLILASQSPRRRQLLIDAGYSFEICAPGDDVEEGVEPGLSPRRFVAESALVKARHIAATLLSEPERQSGYSALVLAADTVAVCDGKILGKPRDVDHAREMLTLVSGCEHQVLTGVCLWRLPDNKNVVHVESTTLVMDPLSDQMLQEILDSNLWVGKAGAFGYQDGLDWVHIVDGLESNVVGLPVERLDAWIRQL